MAPVITSLSVNNAVINEDGSVTISGTFTDVGTQDTHAVSIDWGSGETSSVAVVVEANGSGSFTATHQYLDDNPTGSAFDLYTITATLTDDDGGTATSSTSLTVNNVAPVITSLSVNNAVINEDGSVTISGTFTDVGTQDTHAVSIDWGSGETRPWLSSLKPMEAAALPLLISISMTILLARPSIYTSSRQP